MTAADAISLTLSPRQVLLAAILFSVGLAAILTVAVFVVETAAKPFKAVTRKRAAPMICRPAVARVRHSSQS